MDSVIMSGYLLSEISRNPIRDVRQYCRQRFPTIAAVPQNNKYSSWYSMLAAFPIHSGIFTLQWVRIPILMETKQQLDNQLERKLPSSTWPSMNVQCMLNMASSALGMPVFAGWLNEKEVFVRFQSTLEIMHFDVEGLFDIFFHICIHRGNAPVVGRFYLLRQNCDLRQCSDFILRELRGQQSNPFFHVVLGIE
ncbi:hypothetical protein OUZ56_005489 [Daphnia magna]|uniref:Uncharacterized protein n=1 Tax=Daphnia magna TaxID=35525 RepID=A0ABQ9YSX6_9CRUS|nr:hypothetical protein OUZ56_005489 [Daphnia magna]